MGRNANNSYIESDLPIYKCTYLLPTIDIDDVTYEELQELIKRLEPYGRIFGQKVSPQDAMTEALAVANLMWSDKGFVEGRLKEVAKDLEKQKEDFQNRSR